MAGKPPLPPERKTLDHLVVKTPQRKLRLRQRKKGQ